MAQPLATANIISHTAHTPWCFTTSIDDVAEAEWHIGDPAGGLVQVLRLRVDPDQVRRGYGSRLMRVVAEHAAHVLAQRGHVLRRVWITARQKQDIRLRAFLTRNGFHHVGGSLQLLTNEELLMYSKSFD